MSALPEEAAGLYRKYEIFARPGAQFIMLGSETAADVAAKLLGESYVTTTWPDEPKAWKHVDLEPLRGRAGLLIPSNTTEGRRAMKQMAERLATLGHSLRITSTDGMPAGWTVADWQKSAEEFVTWAKPRTQPYVRTEKRINGHHVLGEIFYRTMSEIEAKPINWLWPGRIAKGKVSMIVGNPGLGKSQVCASLTSVVSRGGYWPVDRSPCAQGSVVILSAEDDPEDTIRPRLEAAEADLERVHILDAIRCQNEHGEDAKRGFDLTSDVARLGALLAEIEDVSLVIIDPITAYLGDADSHKNAEVRALLAPLAEMASRHGAAVIAVSHLTKSAGMDALLRVQGSIGFAAAARAVWGVAKDKDNPSRRLFMPLKNNLGTDTNGFAYTVEGFRLPGTEIDTSHVMWENQIVTQTADEVFGQAEQGQDEREHLLEAKMYLRSMLADGPVAVKVIEADSRGAGHSWATIRRAQKDLGVHAYREHGIGAKGKWYWRLDGSSER